MSADEKRLTDSVDEALEDPEFEWDRLASQRDPAEERELMEELRGVWSIYRFNMKLQNDRLEDDKGIAAPAGHSHQAREPTQREFPRRWLRFEIRERLGGGAQGSVFRAFDENLQKEFALKLRPL